MSRFSDWFSGLFYGQSQRAEKRNQNIGEMRFNEAQLLNNPGMLKIMQMFGGQPGLTLSAVFAAVEIISNSIAQLPIKISRINSDGSKEAVPNHPILVAMQEGLLSQFMLVKQIVRDMYVSGNGFAYIKRSQNGEVSELVYLKPGDVTIHYNEMTHELYYISPVIKTRQGKIQPRDMIHLYKNTINGVSGISILGSAYRTIELANLTEDSASQWFKNGGNLTGIISVKGPSDDEGREKIASEFKRMYGSSNLESGNVAVFPNDLEYQTIQSNAAEAQLLESRQYDVIEIARWFNISPVLLGDLSHSSYSTIEASNLQFLTQTLQPVIRLVEQELNRKLLTDTEKSLLVIDLDETYMLRSDKSSTSQYYSTLVTNGILTINEARTALGYGRIDGGHADDLIIPFTDISQNTVNADDKTEEEKTEDVRQEEEVNQEEETEEAKAE